MKVLPTDLPEVQLIEPDVYQDSRGHLFERYNEERFAQHGLPTRFPQENQSFSRRGVIRGLHYQLRRPQGKLIQCVRGAVWDVAVDIRQGSPNFGRWTGVELSDARKQLLWIPAGFAHGFCVVSDEAELQYKCTDLFDPTDDSGIAWSDDDLRIPWPISNPTLSDKDRRLPRFSQAQLPTFHQPAAAAQ